MSSALLQSAPFREEFEAFALEERDGVLPERPILFYGSSSIRLWETLARDFDGWPVVNRGFGGSTLADCVAQLDKLVTPVQPRGIVLYAGDNDLDHGASPETVLARFEQFAGGVRSRLGWVPLIFISIKPSPSRFGNARQIERTNALIEQAIGARWKEAHFIDVWPAMLNAHGTPCRELFTDDGLHMSPAGYALWTAAIQRALAETGLHGESRVS